MEEKTYIRISLPGSDGKGGYTDTLEGAIETLRHMVENHEDGNPDSYEFSTVSMTEEEFENLPEFTGF